MTSSVPSSAPSEVYATREEIRRAAGHLLICGFDGVGLSAETKELLRETRPLGVIAFKRNVEHPEQVAELNRELKLWRSDEPLLTSVDQEGGRVARIRAPATEWPNMRSLGDIGDGGLVRRLGFALGREVRAMGFDVDYAPVLDVDTNPNNPVIGDRSFSRDAKVVAELAVELMAGLHEAGVGAVGKHFPGHGDTDKDSHLELPRLSHEPRRLREVEWPPFARAIAAGLQAVMTAHVVVDGFDDSLPATLSKRALEPLRKELGFTGAIISDDVEMKAVADHYSLEQMAVLGLNAGIDVFLACNRPEVTVGLYRAIVQAAEQRTVSHARLLDAEKRALAFRGRFTQPAGKVAAVKRWVGCAEHQALLEEVAARRARLSA